MWEKLRTFFAPFNIFILVFLDPKYQGIALAALIVLSGGTVFYHLVERWSWIDSFYFCIVALATVGFGDLTPTKTISKIFTIFYLLSGLGIFLAFINAILGEMKEQREKRIRSKKK